MKKKTMQSGIISQRHSVVRINELVSCVTGESRRMNKLSKETVSRSKSCQVPESCKSFGVE